MVNGFLRGFYGTEASALRCGLYCLLAVWLAEEGIALARPVPEFDDLAARADHGGQRDAPQPVLRH